MYVHTRFFTLSIFRNVFITKFERSSFLFQKMALFKFYLATIIAFEA